MVKLVKLAKISGVMHEADHAYSIWSTWRLLQLATNVPFVACVINFPCCVMFSGIKLSMGSFVLFVFFLPITLSCRIFVLFYNVECRMLEL